MAIEFEWDTVKARSNFAKHRVSFDEAATVLADPLALTIADPKHSGTGEERWVSMGSSARGRLLVVVHSDQDTRIRVISARLATRHERAGYEEDL